MKKNYHMVDCRSWKIKTKIVKIFHTDFNHNEIIFKKYPPVKNRFFRVNNVYSFLLKIKTISIHFGKIASQNFNLRKIFSPIKNILLCIFDNFQKKLENLDFNNDQTIMFKKNINDINFFILKQSNFSRNEFLGLNSGLINIKGLNRKKRSGTRSYKKIIILSTW